MNAFLVFGLLVSLNTVAALKILYPLPENQVLIEGEPMTVSCMVGNSYSSGSSAYPNITYKRKDNFGDKTDITIGQRIQITSSTRNDTAQGLLITTAVLHVKQVRPSDDTSNGQWICYYFAAGVQPDDSAFTVNIVEKKYLPTGIIKQAGNVTAYQYGDPANLTCDITDGTTPNMAFLTRVAWAKDMVILKNGTSITTLEPLFIEHLSGSDAGEYGCVGIAKLKNVVDRFLVLDKTTIYIKLKIDKGTTTVRGDESSVVTMDCPAEGSRFNVTWWKVDEEGQQVQLGNNQRYIISRPCASCRYRLMIKNMQPSDQGRYICKATGDKGMGMHYFKLSLGACPQGMYGQYCSQTCLCKNNATCDDEGNCTCVEGFTGRYCEAMLATSPAPFTKVIDSAEKSSALVPVLVGVFVAIVVVIVIVAVFVYLKRKRESDDKVIFKRQKVKNEDKPDEHVKLYSEIPEDDPKRSENI